MNQRTKSSDSRAEVWPAILELLVPHTAVNVFSAETHFPFPHASTTTQVEEQ